MMYPFVMEPVYKRTIWGGRNLEKLGKNLPRGKIAEAWEASTHPDGLSRVLNGVFAGRSLKELVDLYPAEILGTVMQSKEFPLLFKLIDANDMLSVQVHPDDLYARMFEQQPFGKCEAWYVLDAMPGADIVYGLVPGCSREQFEKAIRENRIAECLHTVQVKPGDLFEVRPGMVHAIGGGIVLAEIQQNCNLTYRVYDYNRVDAQGNKRELHIEKALDVIDFNANVPLVNAKNKIVKNEYFGLEVADIYGSLNMSTEGQGFQIVFVCEGEAVIQYENGAVEVSKGETVLIPAALGYWEIDGACRILRMHAARLEK